MLFSPWCSKGLCTSGHTAPPHHPVRVVRMEIWQRCPCGLRPSHPSTNGTAGSHKSEGSQSPKGWPGALEPRAGRSPGPSPCREHCPAHLCLLEQLDDESQPVGEQLLQLQADDGQRQHGALELQELETGHAVQQLLGECRHVLRGARRGQQGQELRPAGHCHGMELRTQAQGAAGSTPWEQPGHTRILQPNPGGNFRPMGNPPKLGAAFLSRPAWAVGSRALQKACPPPFPSSAHVAFRGPTQTPQARSKDKIPQRTSGHLLCSPLTHGSGSWPCRSAAGTDPRSQLTLGALSMAALLVSLLPGVSL